MKIKKSSLTSGQTARRLEAKALKTVSRKIAEWSIKMVYNNMTQEVQFAVKQLSLKEPSISFDRIDRNYIIEYIDALEDEIAKNKDKIARRNMQIKDLKAKYNRVMDYIDTTEQTDALNNHDIC